MKQIYQWQKYNHSKKCRSCSIKWLMIWLQKKYFSYKKCSRYCNNVKTTFKDGYRQYKPSNILLSFLNACVSILGLLLLRAIIFWYVFPIFDILGINYSPPFNFLPSILSCNQSLIKQVQSYYDKCFMLST